LLIFQSSRRGQSGGTPQRRPAFFRSAEIEVLSAESEAFTQHFLTQHYRNAGRRCGVPPLWPAVRTVGTTSRYFFATAGAAVFWKLYVPPNFLLNRSTRPAVSTNFCLPVKNGWHMLQISTLILADVLRVTNVFPQAQ
jgi:hypothetical protein